MINFLELKKAEDKIAFLENESNNLSQYIATQTNYKNSLASCAKFNSTAKKPILADEISESTELVASNIKNLELLQKALKKIQKKEVIDAVSVKSYNQLYLDVELNITETSETVEKLINEFDDKKVNSVKTIDAIEKDSEKNITCFFPKSNSDVFAISTIYKKFLIYIKENRTVRVSIDEEDFDISIKTPNVQISNDTYSVLISRKSNGYEIITNLNVELTSQFTIPRICKDHDFLKFNLSEFDFTLSIDNDMLSFADTDETTKIKTQAIDKDSKIATTINETMQNAKNSNITPQDYSTALNTVVPMPTEPVKPAQVAKIYEPVTDIPASNISNKEKIAEPIESKQTKPANIVTEQSEPSPSGLQDNNTLYISSEANKIILPYKIADLEKTLQKNPKKYSSIDEVIEKDYTIAADQFKNPVRSRFKEAYKLIKKKEKGSLKEAIDLGIELMFQSNLNPAIITACKNLRELDIYLNCLDENELDKFNCFEIIYKVPPTAK